VPDRLREWLRGLAHRHLLLELLLLAALAALAVLHATTPVSIYARF